MEPGITGLADVRGESKREIQIGRERQRESKRERGEETSLLRANKRNCTRICPHPPAHAAYTVIVFPLRLAFSRSRLAGRHYGDYDLIDVAA